MRVSSRSRSTIALALLLAGASGCNLLLDIDRLDRGSGGSAGSGTTTGSAGSAGGVETIAAGECNPGKIVVSGGSVYWTIISGSGKNGCANTPRNAIRRLDPGESASPVDVVSSNLDGANTKGRPWQIAVIGNELYWVGSDGIICTADAGGSEQGCGDPAISLAPCPSLSLRPAGTGFYLHSGDCAAGGEVRRYDIATKQLAAPGLSVSGNFVHEIDAYAPAPEWVAWIDLPDAACKAAGNTRQVNVALPPEAMPAQGWSSCAAGFPARAASDVAVDSERLYWLQDEADGTGSLYVLALATLAANDKPTLVVRGLNKPKAIALDAQHVYITSLDRNGAVLFVGKDIPKTSMTPGELGAVAENRDVPYDITADDPEWVYWLSIGAHAVERARKPSQ
jgi:hypothetical protein